MLATLPLKGNVPLGTVVQQFDRTRQFSKDPIFYQLINNHVCLVRRPSSTKTHSLQYAVLVELILILSHRSLSWYGELCSLRAPHLQK